MICFQHYCDRADSSPQLCRIGMNKRKSGIERNGAGDETNTIVRDVEKKNESAGVKAKERLGERKREE